MALKPASNFPSWRRSPASSSGLAEVSYRFLREAAVKEAKTNPISLVDSCDAHPMLLRAANAIGAPTGRLCAICEQDELVLVRYAFGPGLPAEGRCLEDDADQARLAKKVGVFTCRVVEVCCSCSWNYLTGSYTVKGSGEAAG